MNPWSRRRFLTHASALGAAGSLGLQCRVAKAEPPPETTRLRLWEGPVTCIGPQYIAYELLRAEGFSNVEYVKWTPERSAWPPENVLAGDVDISLAFVPTDIRHIAAGEPVVILAGSHIGCLEVIGGNRVRTTRELKGKRVAIPRAGTDEEIFISMFAAYVGLNPRNDIQWVNG